MRIRFRYSLTTLLLLPLLAGIAIKWYRGPHQYTFAEEREWESAKAQQTNGPVFVCDVGPPVSEGTFWAYRNLDGTVTRHGLEITRDYTGHKRIVEYRGGVKQGEYREWDREGNLCLVGQYDNDARVGEWLDYYRDGTIYRRVEYDNDSGLVSEQVFELARLSERRITNRESGEVKLTAYHENGQKRLEARFVDGHEEGLWRWWDTSGQQVRLATFHDGAPDGFDDFSRVKDFCREMLGFDFREVPIEDVVAFLNERELRTRLECSNGWAKEIRSRTLTTVNDMEGPLSLYLGLRDIGLTFKVRMYDGQNETLVIYPIDGH